MRMNKIFSISLPLALLALSLAGCKKDNTTEQEVITTVVVHLTAADGSYNQEFEWNDPDGAGGNNPAIDNIVLPSGKTYSCQIRVYDRSKTPEVDIAAEIKAENTAHLFVYIPDGVDIIVTPTDTDDNGKPFRIATNWAAGAPSVGSMTILLKHEPDKNAANPDLTGETDFEVAFPVRIQ